jgi:hypothetical protein
MMGPHAVYVLPGVARPRTGALSRTARVLSGMRGTVWITKDGFHTVRGEFTAVTSVPVFGILAHVLPGTHVEITTSPVNESTWLLASWNQTLKLSKFIVFRSTEETRTTFSDYRLNDEVLRELLGPPPATPASAR